MLFRTHVVFGIVCWFFLKWIIDMPWFVLAFVLLGVVFVDIDSSKSKVGRKFWFLSWIFRHRGILHSLLACLFLSLVFGLIFSSWSAWGGFGFFIGYISHLVLDMFTVFGVRLFWPLKVKVKGFVRSGSWVEDVIFVLLLIFDVFSSVILIF